MIHGNFYLNAIYGNSWMFFFLTKLWVSRNIRNLYSILLFYIKKKKIDDFWRWKNGNVVEKKKKNDIVKLKRKEKSWKSSRPKCYIKRKPSMIHFSLDIIPSIPLSLPPLLSRRHHPKWKSRNLTFGTISARLLKKAHKLIKCHKF